jgi:uncharacterized protein YebE (UPF0316 family)
MELYLPLLIFLARIMDVSIGTVRIIVVIRGHKFWAAALGFFEVAIWLFAVSAVIATIRDNYWNVLGYAAGFAAGNLVGMWIEEKLALGNQMVRIINTDPMTSVAEALRERGYLVTQVPAHGVSGAAELCFVVVPRKQTREVMRQATQTAPLAFITVEDIREVSGGSTIYSREATKLPVFRRLIKFR